MGRTMELKKEGSSIAKGLWVGNFMEPGVFDILAAALCLKGVALLGSEAGRATTKGASEGEEE